MLSKIQWMDTSGHKLENASKYYGAISDAIEWLWLLIFVIILLILPPTPPSPRPALCFLPTEAWAVHCASPAVEVSRRSTQPDGPGVLLSWNLQHKGYLHLSELSLMTDESDGIPWEVSRDLSQFSSAEKPGLLFATLQRWARAFLPSVVSSCACPRGNPTLPSHYLPPAFLGYLGIWRGFFL